MISRETFPPDFTYGPASDRKHEESAPTRAFRQQATVRGTQERAHKTSQSCCASPGTTTTGSACEATATTPPCHPRPNEGWAADGPGHPPKLPPSRLVVCSSSFFPQTPIEELQTLNEQPAGGKTSARV